MYNKIQKHLSNKKENNKKPLKNIKTKRIVSDDIQNGTRIPHPVTREREHACIRLYEDERIEDILREMQNIKLDIVKIKQQISAHDYNICKKLKK